VIADAEEDLLPLHHTGASRRDFDEEQLDDFEAKGGGRSYRKECFPAESLKRCSVRLIER